MSDCVVDRLARRLGCTESYPDWYTVRRLARQRLAVSIKSLLRRPAARAIRDPAYIARCTLARLPELGLFPDERQQQRALREHGLSMRDVRDWRYWALLTAMTCLAAAAGFLAGAAAVRILGMPATGAVNYWIRLAVMVASFWLLVSRTQRFGAAMRLRLTLIKLGVPVCVKCGYALFGHAPQATRCPECGCKVDERVAALLAAPQSDGRPLPFETRQHDRAA